MSNNSTSTRIIDKLDKAIQEYIDLAKSQGIKPTRDTMVAMVTSRLKELVSLSPENKETTLIVSSIAVGMVIVLNIEEKLRLNE